jgi:uncharacterized protein (UPF0147 family)
MRIEDIFTQSIDTKNLRKNQKQVGDSGFAQAEPKVDTVTISQTAQEARKSGVDLARAAMEAQKSREQNPENNSGTFSKKAEPISEAKSQFKAYMDKITGRVPSPPKTPEERMEELAEKIKTLKNKLGEIMNDTNIPENVKSSRMEAINSQIKAAQEQLDQIGKDLAKQAATA